MSENMKKVYIVIVGDIYENSVAAVFDDKKKAEKYIEVHEQINEFDEYYLHEYEIEDIDLNTEVKPYYQYMISLEDIDLDTEADATPELRIYDKDIVIEQDEYMILVYSINSFEEAKQIAMKLYEKWREKDESKSGKE